MGNVCTSSSGTVVNANRNSSSNHSPSEVIPQSTQSAITAVVLDGKDVLVSDDVEGSIDTEAQAAVFNNKTSVDATDIVYESQQTEANELKDKDEQQNPSNEEEQSVNDIQEEKDSVAIEDTKASQKETPSRTTEVTSSNNPQILTENEERTNTNDMGEHNASDCQSNEASIRSAQAGLPTEDASPTVNDRNNTAASDPDQNKGEEVTTVKQQAQENEHQAENVEDQQAEHVEDQQAENVEEQQAENVEEQQAENVKEQQAENVEEQQAENVEEQQAENVEEQQAENVEEQQAGNVEEQQAENVEEQQAGNVEDQQESKQEETDTSDQLSLPYEEEAVHNSIDGILIRKLLIQEDCDLQTIIENLQDAETLKAWWRHLDGNGNGIVSLSEIHKFVQDKQWKVSRPAMMQAYQFAIARTDDFVQRRDFPRLLRGMVFMNRLWSIFDTIDSSNDRRIDLDEFKHAFTKMHYPLTDEAATFAFDQIDHDDGGKVLFGEFCRYIASLACPMEIEFDDSEESAS
eukprot:gene10438-2569_t